MVLVRWVLPLGCVLLGVIAGCSVETFGLASDAASEADGGTRIDAATDAARSGIDAPADSSWDAGPGLTEAPRPDAGFDADPAVEPTWTVIETITVDSADPEPTYSRTVLEAGVVYRLRVSGTITNVIDSHQGDADWYDFGDPKDNGCCEDIGLGIDDLVVDDLDTQPDWGPYDPTHVYEVEWTGDGTTISALFQDTYYGNNIGDLTLEILALR